MKLPIQLLLAWTVVGCGNHAIDAGPFRYLGEDSHRSRDGGSDNFDAGTLDSGEATTSDQQQSDANVDGPADRAASSSALPRLSHRQWARAAQALLDLEAAPDVSRFVVDPATGTGFDNSSDRLEIAPALWTDYQTLSETLAAEVASSPDKLERLLPSGLPKEGSERVKAFVSQLGERAFRRPLTNGELEQYTELFAGAAHFFPNRDAFSAGAELTITALLQAPAFVYRIESPREVELDGTIARSDFEIATQLSMMLWDGPPDEPLMAAAKAEALHSPEDIALQAHRMLGAPQAQDKLLDFYRQWLELRSYDTLHVEGLSQMPGTTLREEAERFIGAMLLEEGHSVASLFTSSVTFANRDLAKLYNLPGEFGDDLVRTKLDEKERAGFLTHVGFLASTAGQTAPIHRGVFVNRRLLCASLPPPPNFTPGQMMGDTRRERIESITGAGTCGAGCHATLINPAGYPLEYFDDGGRYRNQDNGQTVDGAATYPFSDGAQTYADAVSFSRVLATSRQLHSCYVKHLLEFSLGRLSSEDDTALLERLANASRQREASVSDLLLLLVQSKSFLYRRAVQQ